MLRLTPAKEAPHDTGVGAAGVVIGEPGGADFIANKPGLSPVFQGTRCGPIFESSCRKVASGPNLLRFQRSSLPPFQKTLPQISHTCLPVNLVRSMLFQCSSQFPSLSLFRFPILHRRAPTNLIFTDPVVTATL